jgi:hypothetical protein
MRRKTMQRRGFLKAIGTVMASVGLVGRSEPVKAKEYAEIEQAYNHDPMVSEDFDGSESWESADEQDDYQADALLYGCKTVTAGERLEVGDPVVLKHGKGFRWVPYDYMISKEGYIFDDNRKFDYNCRWKSNSPGKIEMED